MNEWTHFFIKIYLSHFILERVDVGCVWEVSWRREQTTTYWPKVLLTIVALLPHSGWAAQPWVTEGPNPSVCRWFLRGHLVPNWLQLQLELTDWLTQAVCGTWLYNCLTFTCFLWAYASTTSTGQSDIPISSTGCTCFAVLPLIYIGASLDWRLGRGSICYTGNKRLHAQWLVNKVMLTVFWGMIWPMTIDFPENDAIVNNASYFRLLQQKFTLFIEQS